MHKLYELKENLCKELEEYGKESDISSSSLDTIDKLAHAIKNIDKIISSNEDEESGYSRRMSPYYRDEEPYAYRGRSRNARRDSMGRYSSEGYSRNDEITSKLYNMMDNVHDERTRQDIQKLLDRMESM